MHANILYILAIFSAGVLVGVLALGELESDTEHDVNGVEAASASVKSGTPRRATSAPEPASTSSNKLLPGASAAIATSDDEQSTRIQASAAGANDTPRLQQLEHAVNRLSQRIIVLEQALALQEQQPESGAFVVQDAEEEEPEQLADTPENRQEALIDSGVEPDLAADIVWRQSQRALERLEMQDLARREGWFGSDRYFDELSKLETSAVGLHEEIGDAAYDRYLYSMGKSNRVMVDSVIQGSPAEQAGLVTGDIIISYADERLFGWSELRQATASGERGETVMVRVLRGQDMVDFFMPRGPLGVRLDTTIMAPLE